jgi:hypothetical protein
LKSEKKRLEKIQEIETMNQEIKMQKIKLERMRLENQRHAKEESELVYAEVGETNIEGEDYMMVENPISMESPEMRDYLQLEIMDQRQ